jgi:hypothetical protein
MNGTQNPKEPNPTANTSPNIAGLTPTGVGPSYFRMAKKANTIAPAGITSSGMPNTERTLSSPRIRAMNPEIRSGTWSSWSSNPGSADMAIWAMMSVSVVIGSITPRKPGKKTAAAGARARFPLIR